MIGIIVQCDSFFRINVGFLFQVEGFIGFFLGKPPQVDGSFSGIFQHYFSLYLELDNEELFPLVMNHFVMNQV